MSAASATMSSLAQRSAEVRGARSQLKEELAAGQINLGQLLRRPPDFAEGMRIEDVLLAMPRIWKGKKHRALVAAGIKEGTELGRLTARQQRRLLEHFADEHPGIWTLWQVMWAKAAREANT